MGAWSCLCEEFCSNIRVSTSLSKIRFHRYRFLYKNVGRGRVLKKGGGGHYLR